MYYTSGQCRRFGSLYFLMKARFSASIHFTVRRRRFHLTRGRK